MVHGVGGHEEMEKDLESKERRGGHLSRMPSLHCTFG